MDSDSSSDSELPPDPFDDSLSFAEQFAEQFESSGDESDGYFSSFEKFFERVDTSNPMEARTRNAIENNDLDEFKRLVNEEDAFDHMSVRFQSINQAALLNRTNFIRYICELDDTNDFTLEQSIKYLLAHREVKASTFRVIVNHITRNIDLSVFNIATNNHRLDVATLLIPKVGREIIRSDITSFEYLIENHDVEGVEWMIKNDLFSETMKSRVMDVAIIADNVRIFELILSAGNFRGDEPLLQKCTIFGSMELTKYCLKNSLGNPWSFLMNPDVSQKFGYYRRNRNCTKLVLRDRRLYDNVANFHELVDMYFRFYADIKKEASDRRNQITTIAMLHRNGKIGDDWVKILERSVDLSDGIYPLKDYQNEEKNVKQAMAFIKKLMD
jgi:hypothetical protein